MQKPESLRLHFSADQRETGGVSAGSTEAFDHPRRNWISGHAKDNRNLGGRPLSRLRRGIPSDGYEQSHPAVQKFGSQCGQQIVLPTGPTELDGNVLAFYETRFA